MKEFEKWYAKEKQRRRGAPMYSADYRTGWQVALKWTQNRIIERLKLASFDDNVACVKKIEADIKQELKDERI